MKENRLYRIKDVKWKHTWIIIFRTYCDANGTYCANGTFFSDIVATNFKIGDNYLNVLFSGGKVIVPFNIQELPLYINYHKSPLFDKLLKGELVYEQHEQ